MDTKRPLSTLIAAFTIITSLSALAGVKTFAERKEVHTAAAGTEPERAPAKAYAVFVVAYNEDLTVARGGVAGTAFFVSASKAITAYHVLQPLSFQVQPGLKRQRVYLVHENEAAIELSADEVRFSPKTDTTEINLHQARVQTKYVYQLEAPAGVDRLGKLSEGAVETEGFVANTVGPILARVGRDVEIISVPKLERVHLKGEFVRAADVSLLATDVKLEQIPCLEVTYQPIRGISGGPLIREGRVIGMNSFGDPSGATRTWAVNLAVNLEKADRNLRPL